MTSKPYRISGENYTGMAVETPGGGLWCRKTFTDGDHWYHNQQKVDWNTVPKSIWRALVA